MKKQLCREMLEFIKTSPCARLVADNLRHKLLSEGYEELFENEVWDISEGGRYFTVKGGSTVIAFRIPSDGYDSFHAVLTHSDSPALKLKPNFNIDSKSAQKLSVEKYGGPVLGSLFDIPLDIAGTVLFSREDTVEEKTVHLKNACIIPRVAPHLSREETQTSPVDMSPIYSLNGQSLSKRIADMLEIYPEDIISHDLYVVSGLNGYIWGENDEFISSPRLDNLQSVFTALVGFLNSDEETSVPVMAVFDGEEIGSGGEQGAGSTVLSDTLRLISESLGKSFGEHLAVLSNSLFVSADSAHAFNPNHPEVYDRDNAPDINSGVAIKYNAQKKYTTTALSAALFSKIAKMAQVPCKVYANKSNIPGGSTLGHISQSHVSVMSVDIGAPIWSMHSSLETGGCEDTEYLARAFEMFYSVSFEKEGNSYIVK